MSVSSFVTVFFATPVMRTVARIELPSTSAGDDLLALLRRQPIHTDHYA